MSQIIFMAGMTETWLDNTPASWILLNV